MDGLLTLCPYYRDGLGSCVSHTQALGWNNCLAASDADCSNAALFVADLILGDAGVAARLAVDTVRFLGFSGWFVAQTGTHELLTRVAGHTFRLHIAVSHSLLLRVDLGAGGHR